MRGFIRACIAVARAKASHNSLAVSEIVRRTWPNDEIARQITRAASEPPATISGIAALARIVLPDFVAAMTPYSASARLLQYAPSFTFDGASYVSVPSFAASPTAAPPFP